MVLANPEIRLNRFKTVSIVSRPCPFYYSYIGHGFGRYSEESSLFVHKSHRATDDGADCSDLINDRRRRGRRPTVLHLIKRIRHIGVDRSHRSKFTHGIRSNDQKDIIFS